MTSTLASTYTSPEATFVGGSFGGEGGNTNAHPSASPQKPSPRSPSSLKAAGGLSPSACVRLTTSESVKSQQCCQSYLRQYTYDVFPYSQQQQSSSNSSGDHPSAWSRSLYSETTRPYSSAGAHSSTSATSDEEEEVTQSTPRRPNHRLGRKLNLTFLPGDRLSSSTQIDHLPPRHIQPGVALAAQSLSKPFNPVESVHQAFASPHLEQQVEFACDQRLYSLDKKAQQQSGDSQETPHVSSQHHHTISSEPNLVQHRSPSVADQPPFASILAATPSVNDPDVLSDPHEMPVDVDHIVADTNVCINDNAPLISSASSTSSRPPDPFEAQSPLKNRSSSDALKDSSSTNVTVRQKTAQPHSREQAANIIARAWRSWKQAQEAHLTAVVEAIRQARESAAITIQRVWKGHQLRRFVHSEVCKLRILYWEPSMNGISDRELEKNWTVKIFGAFTVPAWKSEVAMEYCRLRRMFVLYTNVPQGRYECKFIVNGRHTSCPWLHETVTNPDGIENSLVTVAAHPLKTWWGKRLAYLEKSRRGKTFKSKGLQASSGPREISAVSSH